MSDSHPVDILAPPSYLPNGETQGIVEAIRAGAWLHIAAVWLYRNEPYLQLLFQQRDANSPMFPAMLDTSSAGHLEAGETAVKGGLRELREELGIVAEESDLIDLGRHLNAGLDQHGQERKWVLNTYCFNWAHELSELVMAPDEVPASFWIDIEEFLSIENGGAIKITGLTCDGKELERTVSREDFVYNVDNYHYRIAERIRNLVIAKSRKELK